MANTTDNTFYNYDDYFDFEPEMSDTASLNAVQRPKKLPFNGLTRTDLLPLADGQETPSETTECITTMPMHSQETDGTNDADKPSTGEKPEQQSTSGDDHTARQLQNLVQLLYVAQARVQLEATEIKKAQAVANTAQQALEEAATHVRAITASLQNSQQEVASAAIRAQTAQLQLAAHDQLLFAARQDVDALSTQLVGLEAAESITQPKSSVNLADLLDKLKQPLPESQKPTPVPSVVQMATQSSNQRLTQKFQNYRVPELQHFYHN